MFTVTDAQRRELDAVCRRTGIARLELTGSAARGSDFDPATSDLDLLVEFTPESRLNAFEFIELGEELGRILGRSVDLIELSAVENPIVREALARDRKPFHDAA